MSNCVLKNQTFIRLLAETPSQQQRQVLLESATPDQVRALGDICLNICRGRLNKQIEKLDKRKRKPVQKLATKGIAIKEKRKALSQAHKGQKGAGLFSVLLPLALSTLPALLKK